MFRPNLVDSIISLTMCFLMIVAPLTALSSNYGETALDEETRKYYTTGSLNMPGFQSGSIYSNDTISVGDQYACAVSNGDVLCWGRNYYGTIGYIHTPGEGLQYGSETNKEYPTNANSLYSHYGYFVEVVAGAQSTCALNTEGDVYCWGGNAYGQLGNGDNDVSDNTAQDREIITPRSVLLPENTSAISISSSERQHKCAILNNSETVCWGQNNWGQLGAGWTCDEDEDSCTEINTDNNYWEYAGTSFPQVVDFPENKSAISVDAGDSFTCAITEDHSIYCWGQNNWGQLGQGNYNSLSSPELVELPGDREAGAIALAKESVCAISMDQNVYCWGRGAIGQLGNGNNQTKTTPTLVILEEGDNPVSITAGGAFYCLILDTGQSKCWGENWHGGLGDGEPLDQWNNGIYQPYPFNVTGNHSFSGIESGLQNTCAIKTNGSAYCWGRPYDGAIGDGSRLMTGQKNWPSRVGTTTNPLFTDASELDHDDDGIITIFDSNPYMCSTGFYQVENICIEVPAGSYSVNGIQYLCDIGTYQPQSGQDSCLEADPGHYVNMINSSDQDECLAGTHQPNSAQSECIENSPGYYSLRGADQQIGCPTGSYQPSANSTDCIPTDPGYFTNSIGSSSQTACPAGSYQPYSSQITCIQASMGYFVASSGSNSQDMCTLGNYSDSLGQSECTLASSGYYVSVDGSSSQEACESGTYQTLQGQTDCMHASAGYYVPSNGSSQQISCPEGSFQPAGGSSSCILADPGFYVSDLGATEQLQCQQGTFSSAEGQDACTPAAPGFFVDTDGATAPSACPAGQYQDSEGSGSCVDSPPGYVTSADGSSTASPCQPGTYAVAGQSSCVDADPGNFVSDSAQSSQQLCEQGTYQPESGQSSCLFSQPGNYVDEYGATEQTPCDEGTYQSGQNKLGCMNADPGNFVPSTGRSYQNICEKGQYQSEAGQSECLMADPGNFVPSSGADKQFPCSPGSYQPASGQSNCEMASEDHFVGESGATEQTPCSSGDVQPNTGALKCLKGPSTFGDYLPILIIPLLIVASALFYKYRKKTDGVVTKKSRNDKWGEKTIDYVPKTIGRKRK